MIVAATRQIRLTERAPAENVRKLISLFRLRNVSKIRSGKSIPIKKTSPITVRLVREKRRDFSFLTVIK